MVLQRPQLTVGVSADHSWSLLEHVGGWTGSRGMLFAKPSRPHGIVAAISHPECPQRNFPTVIGLREIE